VTRQPQRRETRHYRVAAASPPERRGWLSHGIAALAISALGLVAAGSMSLTTSAQPQGGGEPSVAAVAPQTADATTAGSAGTGDGATGGVASPAAQTTAADAFAARASGLDTSRSAELRAALAKERAAQRAEGLAKTAGVITGAALIMVTVFAAFALADSITIKSIGVGMAIAVLIDATIVRILLVPATMRLMGKWNWWAPGPLGRLASRLGFSHAEDDDTVPNPVPVPS